MIDKKIKVLVCGTTFGRIYINGIRKLRPKYEIAGILSRGSKQSRKCAEEYNIPLYTDIEDIDKEKFDLACVVVRTGIVGGQGTNIALKLLSKGINVIQEQPVHYNELLECYKIAKKNNCKYFLNTFYSHLTNIEKFKSIAQKIMKNTSPVYIDASCSLQVLFPLLDILGSMMGGLKPFIIEDKVNIQGEIFSLLSGKLKGIPIAIRVQNQIASNNPDNFFHFLHKITLGTEGGSLILTDTNGSILWNPRLFIPHDETGTLNLYTSPKYLNLPVTEIITANEEVTYKEIYEDLWPEAISNAIEYFTILLDDECKYKSSMQYNLSLCSVWNSVGEAIGVSKDVNAKTVIPLTLEDMGIKK